MVRPPSMTRIWPVINVFPVARKTAASATSSAVAGRCNGVWVMARAIMS